MSAAARRIESMRANPRADWRIEDLEAAARSMGMTVRKSGGSHVVFAHVGVATRLTVPARRPIKPIYIVKFVDFVDEIRGAL